MRLGDTCTIKDVEGIVTYLDFENNYAEITKKQNSICDTFTVNENDWFSIHYKDEHWRSPSGDIVSITKQNLDDQFISIKYLDGDDEYIEKEITSQRVYNVVFPINVKDAPGKPGDLFEILSIDRENGIITCINNDDENAEEINVDVSKGISKNTTSFTSIIDFCEISYSSSSESDSDIEAESDSKKQNEKNYTMKDEIHENDKQLTKEQKRNFIGKSLRLMFKPANLSGNDIIKLIETIFKSIGKKFEPLNDWRNSIINKSKSIIPVLSDYVVHESENEFYEDDNAYFNFVQNEFKTLLIVDNIDSDAVTYNSQAKDASYKDIVLNPSYKYNSIRPILNTSDRVKISKYIVNNTNFEFKNLPPSQQELADAVSQGIDIFKVFNINKYDIPVNYSRVIPTARETSRPRIPTYRHKTKANHPYAIGAQTLTRPSTEPVKKPPVGSYFKMNNNNINIDDTLVWDNSVIWPRNLALKMSKLNSEATSYLLNSYELGKETIPPGIKERETYLKGILTEHSFIEKKTDNIRDWSRPRIRSARGHRQSRSPQASASPATVAWIEAEANPDTEIENKIHILTCGEYVRDAIKGENPYYFIDIYSGNKFIPRHELLKLKIKNVTYTSESKYLYNCLLNEWGIEEENTTNIISIINKEFLGLKDAEYNYLDNKTYVSNVDMQEDTTTASDIDDFFMRMGFMNGFKTLLAVFSSKIQYKLGLTVNFEEYSIVSSKFFNSGEWVIYRTIYSYPHSFDKTTTLLATSKKLMRFEKSIEKLLSALNTLKKSNPKDKKIPTIYKRLKSELTKSKANYINKLWTLVGIYITSYLYSRIDIDDNAKIKIYSQFAEELSNTAVDPPLWAEDVSIFNEKNIKKFSNKLWEYSTITDKKYNYSYTKPITPRIINKRRRISELSLFNNIKPLEYEQLVLGVVQKRRALLGRVGHASTAPPALGDRWELYNSGKIIKDNGWYLIKNAQDIPEEEQYNCLLNNICYIVLQSSVSQTNFKFPKKLKELKDKGYEERMNTWLGEIYEIREYIGNIEFSNELIKTITSDVIAFRESLRRAALPLPGRTAWTYLMQHLINEPPMSELSYTDYVNVLERIISYYIRNITKICGNNLVMNKSKVENIYATAAEDEASSFFDNKAGDKISQRLLKEERARSLGLFAKGLQKQFDIKTVQPAETAGPNGYENEWGQNFDNSDDHDGSFDD